ncbi:hypothetical protein EUX98_g9535 [Antrodiella citrinella]|uniref:Uncharacterized protein n=1 Tax=Antrodiella citrinella TaxID=2447956 RepID=A0A4V3XEU3_9APHY|nr:hypothetical protein EUX98_g9535 [Antrodiella citrinella]
MPPQPRTTTNSTTGRQDVEVEINCIFFSERNPGSRTFTLPLPKSKFNKPFRFLLEATGSELAIQYNFQANVSTIRFHTLKTTVKVEEVDKDWVHRIDLQAITEFCQSATRIQKILGAPESLNDEALHLLITAAEKVEPLSPLHGSANDLWAKAWEKPWPATKSSISIEEIPQNVEGEPMLPPLEDDDDNQWDYTVLSDSGHEQLIGVACEQTEVTYVLDW